MDFNPDFEHIFKYTEKIQNELYSDISFLEKFFSEHFLILEQKFKIGGDFLWYHKINENQLILALIDIIGKDIRAAFLGLYILYFLNIEIKKYLDSNNKFSPKQFLEIIHEKLWYKFHESESPKLRYGFETGMILLDRSQNKLSYSGANRSLYKIENKKITEFKAERLSIGWKYPYGKEFTQYDIELKKGDTFYMFSDGITDQLGGKDPKTFSSKQTKELLLKINKRPLKEQKKEFLISFNEFKGKEEQTDDMILIGFKY